MREQDYAINAAKTREQGMVSGGNALTSMAMNPTLRENIDQKVQWHKDEIERLEQIKQKLPMLLDVNLRDMREAMQF